jgi:hypothetical protein
MGAMENTSLRFAEAARLLADQIRPLRLVAPAFRSPPRIPGDRSIRRRADGGSTVAVRYRGRPWPAVLGDMVEGVVAANGLSGAEADAVRTRLWAALEAAELVRGPRPPAAPRPARGPVVDAAPTVKRLARVA